MEMRSQDYDIVALFNHGLEEHNAGNLSAAKKMYHEILSIQPDHCEANHNIGIVLVAENELDKALEFFKFAVTASPNVSLFWASYIDTLAKLERIVEAKALIKAAKNSGMSCENIEAVSHRLDIENQEPLAKDTLEIDEFITQQKFDDAIEACLNLLETYPRSGVLNITLGTCYFELGQIDLAISSYTKATEYWPQSEVSYTMLAQIYSVQGDTEHAIQNLRKAVELKPNDYELNSLLGRELTQSGDFDAAIESLEQALKLNPDYAEACFGMGSALNAKGDLDGAIDSYNQAIKLKPDYTDAYNNMGWSLSEKSDFDAAIDSYNKVLKIKPDCADTYFNLGNALNEKGDHEAAIESYKEALKLKPDYAEAYYNTGIALKGQGKREEAIDSYKRAIKLKPDYTYAYNNMGRSLNEKGDFDAAIDSYNKALKIKPDCAEVHNNMGNTLKNQGKPEKAIEAYWKALSLKPDHAEAYNNIGNALQDQGKWAEAIEAYNKALFLKPNYAEAHCNMGLALADQGKPEEAIEACNKALSLKPDFAEAYYNMSLVLLATQDFHQGFKLQEWRWKTAQGTGQLLQSSKPVWNNQQKKSVFVWSEQGIGDEIMFAAMIPELHKLSSKIILRCDARLIPLFKRSFPDDIIYYSNGEAVAEDEYDFHISIGSLSNIFRTSLESFKKTSAGFLNYDRAKTSKLRDIILAGDEKKVIGISWKTKSPKIESVNRSIKLADLAQTLDHPNIRLVCLQYGEVDDELKALKSDLGIEIMQLAEIDNMNDIDGLASLIMACDQVVSTTNVTVHLAGALGANAKVLLPFSTRWFWGSSGSDSFWYDTVSPYRQNNTGDWSDVLRALA